MTFQPQFQANKWTISAAECYFNGCNCKTCDIPLILETKCVMKKTVFELVRKFGKPNLAEIQKENKQAYTKY